MIKIEDYSERIDYLHSQGKYALEIARELGFKYCQPVYNYFKKKGWENLRKGEYPNMTKYNSNQHFFDVIDSEEKAYILGFIAADGHVCDKTYRLMIALKDSDYEMLEKIKSCMNSEHPIVRHIEKRNPYTKSNNLVLEQCALNINGKTLVEPLIKMGLSGRKTYTLDEKIINYIPKELIRHFLRGFFDGDGNVTWGKHYSSGNKYLVQVAGNKEFLLGSFQKYFPSNCNLYKFKASKQCYCWKIANKEEVLKFLNYIYADSKIYLNRKYKIYQYAMWSYKTELIAGNSYFINLIKGQSAANLLVKSLEQVQRLADETILNPYEEDDIEYNSAKNTQQQDTSIVKTTNLVEDIVRTI